MYIKSLSDAEGDCKMGPHYKRRRLYSTNAPIVDVTIPFKAAKEANTRLEYLLKFDICHERQEMSCVRNTAIICTIGK